MEWTLLLWAITNGVMVGSIYGLIALGWVLIYKCSGVLNLAMGELTLIGAYLCLTLYTFLVKIGHPAPFITALALTLLASVVMGYLTERIFLDRLIGEPVLTVIMVTVGLMFVFRGLVGLIWSTDTRIFDPPIFPMEPIIIGGVIIEQVYLWSCIAAAALWLIFFFFFKYTAWGLSMQATADDEMAALSLGISVRFVYSAAWIIAFMTAAVGGTFLGAKNGLNISVGELSLLVLPAVVLGGLNSVAGAIVGGIAIGVLQELSGFLLDPYFPGGVKDTAPYVFMVLFLLFKPYGLWGWVRIERV
jgi:branched-chain amino acid transport system permease protein